MKKIFLFLIIFNFLLFNVYPQSPVKDDSQNVMTNGNNAFGIDLYNKLNSAEGNLFFSPYSISSCFAITYVGAGKDTRKQMGDVFHFPAEQEKCNLGFLNLNEKFKSIQKKGDVELSIANALWVQNDYIFLNEFLNMIKKYYEATIENVDFKNNAKQIGGKINKWVEEKTRNKIKDIISGDGLSPNDKIVIVNAIYFYGKWAKQFKKYQTTDLPFWTSLSSSTKVPMMQQENNFRYGEDKSIQILELPYKGNDLSMVIFLPEQRDGISQLEKKLTFNNINLWMQNVSTCEVNVYLPKFKIELTFGLNQILNSMGMPDAFDLKKADFSGMADIKKSEPLYISEAIHKAFVDVNEEGTEAAAATAIRMATTESMPPKPKVFRADHPFIFIIRENSSGSILFIGRITNLKK